MAMDLDTLIEMRRTLVAARGKIPYPALWSKLETATDRSNVPVHFKSDAATAWGLLPAIYLSVKNELTADLCIETLDACRSFEVKGNDSKTRLLRYEAHVAVDHAAIMELFSCAIASVNRLIDGRDKGLAHA